MLLDSISSLLGGTRAPRPYIKPDGRPAKYIVNHGLAPSRQTRAAPKRRGRGKPVMLGLDRRVMVAGGGVQANARIGKGARLETALPGRWVVLEARPRSTAWAWAVRGFDGARVYVGRMNKALGVAAVYNIRTGRRIGTAVRL